MMSPWLLLLFTFLIGCGAAFNAPAWQASVGDMVPRAQLAHAVALNSMGFNIARSLGPAIGGAIVAAAGAAVAFAVNAASYIGLLFVLLRWRPAPHVQLLPRETLGVAIGAGVRYVAMSPDIRNVLLRSFLFGVGASSLMALLPIVVKVRMGGGPLIFGVMLGAFGIGAVAGALASSRVRLRLSTEGIVRTATIVYAVAMVVVAASGMIALSLISLSIAGAAWVLALSTFNVAVQMSAPRWVVARALSLYQMCAFAGIALGSWLWGLIAHIDGVRIALIVAGVALILSALLGFWRALAETHELNLELLQLWKEPVNDGAGRAAHRPRGHHRAVRDRRGKHHRISASDGRAAPHTPPRRRERLETAARSREPGSLDRAVLDGHLARLRETQQPADSRGRGDPRKAACPASRTRKTHRATHDRASDRRVADRTAIHHVRSGRAADRSDTIDLSGRRASAFCCQIIAAGGRGKNKHRDRPHFRQSG